MTTTDRTVGELEVFGAGQLDVLSVGRGHVRLTVDEDDPDGVAKARKVIQEMMQRGFAIFVEEPDGEVKRVKRFSAKRMAYLIGDQEERPVARTKATAVARSAGGAEPQGYAGVDCPCGGPMLYQRPSDPSSPVACPRCGTTPLDLVRRV